MPATKRICLLLSTLALLPFPGTDADSAWAGRGSRRAEAVREVAPDRRLPLSLPDFVVEGSAEGVLGREFPALIAADLGMTPFFEFPGADAIPEKATSGMFAPGGRAPDLARWGHARVDALLIGRIAGGGDGLTIDVRLYDVARGAVLLGRKWVVPKDGWRIAAHRVANEIQLAFTGFRGVFDTEIAFTAHPPQRDGAGRGKEVYVVGLDGASPRPVTRNGSFNLFPRWSPDGRQLAFTSFRTGLPKIYLRDLESRTEREVVPSGNALSPGCFSPGGDLLYYSRSEGGSTDIFALPLDGGDPIRVAGGAITTSPSVSPDGTRMAFVSDRNGTPAIFVREPGRGAERQVTPSGKFHTSPSWSPTGDLIAYTSQSAGRFSLMLIRPDGSEPRQLAGGAGDCIDPAFSPDGNFVAYTYQEGAHSEIRIVSVDGRANRRVFSGMTGIGSPSWSPRR